MDWLLASRKGLVWKPGQDMFERPISEALCFDTLDKSREGLVSNHTAEWRA
jgi:hypothetical protein